MAVDYFHRLIVRGTSAEVRAFRRRISREYPRSAGRQAWIEVVPFSFQAPYELAPTARRIEREIPVDPYDLSAWPVRRINKQRAEVRYQFHTRNLEMVPVLRPLARAFPALTFMLTTLCLDDASIETYRLSGRHERKWTLPQRRSEFHWNRARKRFRLTGDEVYEDDDASRWAEEEMLAEAVGHWDERGRGQRDRPVRPYRWWSQAPLRDLDTERELAMAALAAELEATITVKARRAKHPVTVFRHDNPAGERTSNMTLTAVLSDIRRRRPRHDSDPNWTFSPGGAREYITINTDGPLAFGGQHPVWRGRTIRGCMVFQLTWDNVQSVLEKFYDGYQAAECFAGLDGSFAQYPRRTQRGDERSHPRTGRLSPPTQSR